MAKASVVVVGCRLPHGIVLEHPMNPKMTVTLTGASKPLLVGSDYGLTEVDGDFWAAWAAVNAEFPAMKSKSIFVVRSIQDAPAAAKELSGEKTGFEQMSQTAGGVKSADAKD